MQKLNEEEKTKELIRRILKRKKQYAFLLLVIFSISFFSLRFYLLDYSANTSFYINNQSMLSSSLTDMRNLEPLSPDDNFNRVLQRINSTDVHIYLIKKFDLIHHYNIDSTGEFYFQKAIQEISSNIAVKRSPYNAVVITVKDRYRYRAAEIANDIVKFIDQDNKQFYIQNIEKKLEISKEFIGDLQLQYKQKGQALDSLLLLFNSVINTQRNQNDRLVLMEEQKRLSTMINRFELATNDLINSQKLYILASASMNKNSLPTITIVNKAFPSTVSLSLEAFLTSFLILLLTIVIIIFSLYVNITNSYFFKAYITSEKEHINTPL